MTDNELVDGLLDRLSSRLLSAVLPKIEQLVKESKEPRKDWYTVDEVAKLLNKSAYTVREYCRLKQIRAEKDGRHYRISVNEVNELKAGRGLLPITVKAA